MDVFGFHLADSGNLILRFWTYISVGIVTEKEDFMLNAV